MLYFQKTFMVFLSLYNLIKGNIGQWKEEGVFIEDEDRGDDRDENSDREFSPISRNRQGCDDDLNES